MLIAIFIIIWIGLINEWALSFGDIIVMVYLLIIFFVAWIVFNFKKYSWDNVSPYVVFSTVATIITTMVIANIMPAPLPVATTTVSTTSWNTGTKNKITTWAIIQPQETKVRELNDIIARAKAAKYVVIDITEIWSQDNYQWHNALNSLYRVYKQTPVVRLNDFSSDFITSINTGSSIEKIHRSQLEKHFFNPQKFPITDYCVTITPNPESWWVIQEFSQCYLQNKSNDSIVSLSQYYQ